jgi:hypothetical protein
MSFFSAFTGSAQRRDLRKANTQANRALDQGYQQSQGYYGNALNTLQPFADSGRQASTAYNDFLGLNGAEARQSRQDMLTSDPLFQGGLAADSNAMLRYMNARGQGAGGAAALAGQRVLQQNYGNWMDRYRDQGAQGFQAAGAQAGIQTQQGDNAYGYGATKAGNQINYGNAMASARGIGVNNLLGAVGAGIGGYNALFNGGR